MNTVAAIAGIVGMFVLGFFANVLFIQPRLHPKQVQDSSVINRTQRYHLVRSDTTYDVKTSTRTGMTIINYYDLEK